MIDAEQPYAFPETDIMVRFSLVVLAAFASTASLLAYVDAAARLA